MGCGQTKNSGDAVAADPAAQPPTQQQQLSVLKVEHPSDEDEEETDLTGVGPKSKQPGKAAKPPAKRTGVKSKAPASPAAGAKGKTPIKVAGLAVVAASPPAAKRNSEAGGAATASLTAASAATPMPAGAASAPSSPAPMSPHASAFTAQDFVGWQKMKLLGKGSFGSVYEAGLRSCKIVCCKEIELGPLEGNKEEIDALQLEIVLMQRLRHPHIVEYYGVLEDPKAKTINIFMEYVTGGTLSGYAHKFKEIPHEVVAKWTYQMLLGIKYLHDCSIVHRDIKGANILVTNDGVLKLADFGCSKAIDEVCSKSRGCQTMVGTPYWMAPEVIKCEPYGAKADIWSVGCTVVEILTGKPAWPEMDSIWSACYKIANSTGLPPNVPKGLPKDMQNFLEKCFERTPSKRATAQELLNHKWMKSVVYP